MQSARIAITAAPANDSISCDACAFVWPPAAPGGEDRCSRSGQACRLERSGGQCGPAAALFLRRDRNTP